MPEIAQFLRISDRRSAVSYTHLDGFLKKTKAFTKGDFSGKFFQAGVSELTMARVANGMALHGGVIPACGTFFVFSDYMKPVSYTHLLYDRIVSARVVSDEYTTPVRDPQELRNFWHPSDHRPIIIDFDMR